MEFLIIPVRDGAVSDMQKIQAGLRAIGCEEYASYVWRKVQLVEADENHPYVEIEMPDKNKKK